ncbi:MAG TPA: GNAT family N-acetyltransferase [Candidatus Binatia bacterium]|jgi:amino-acid N-acetyltransferase|nr:GNAT family N-acetyltransferase [Candidatus Binatia bacterium]
MSIQAAAFAEKDFYLDEFRGKSLLFALRAADLSCEADREAAGEVLRTLLLNDIKVVLLLETADTASERHWVTAWCKHLSARVKFPVASPVVMSATANEDELLEQVWTVLRAAPLFVGLWPVNSDISLVACAQRVAVRLKVYKLVLLDPAGGITTNGNQISFMNGPVLQELLRQGEAEWAGLGTRRPVLEAVRVALEGGVASVTLCPLCGLARELFTYEGCGTLFTLTDYCSVERLGIDDFYEVEKLMQRGEREGYLKGRTPQEIAKLLLHGYGARLGAASGELAGFCALLPYPAENAGEVAGLYTITRFQGEGIGSRLITTIVSEGEQRGFAYLFACTTQEGAQRLFERHGFCRVTSENVPAAKWRGYDAERKQQIAVYRRDLPPPERSLGL